MNSTGGIEGRDGEEPTMHLCVYNLAVSVYSGVV